MNKIINLLVCLSMTFSGSSQSASFDCQYISGLWSSELGTLYYCSVQTSVNIASPDAAHIDSISGTHLNGYNNDNVEALYFPNGQIHYFPRGLGKFFKNLKGIQISSRELKEIHQNDLKDLPKLVDLHSTNSQLEIIEENLFEFNPNLEYIELISNKISHIDPNVFGKLSKLKTLELKSNICINMNASNNPTEVQNVIKTAKAQCTNSDYSNLEQKVKNLEIESTNLNSEKFKKNFENLENEIKNSKFSNFFQEKLQDLKAVQNRKTQDEATTTATLTQITTTIKAPEEPKYSQFETCSALELKLIKIEGKLVENEKTSQENQKKFDEQFGILGQKVSEADQKIAEMDEKASKFTTDTITTLKDIESSNNQNFAAIMKFVEKLDKKMEVIEEKLAGIDNAQNKLMNKIHIMETENHDNKVKVNQKLRAILRAV